MRALRSILATLAVSLPAGVVLADEPATDDDDAPPAVETLVQDTGADLQVKQLPAQLKMRPASPAADAKQPKNKQTAQASPPGSPDPGAGTAAASDSGGSVGYKMFPTTTRDLRDRVVFRIRAGLQVDTAPANGDFQRGGLALPGDFADTRPWLIGDAAVGARGIITPSLNGYFLTSFALDTSDSLATRTATIMPYDQQTLAIKAGYGEWGYDDRKPDDLQPHKVWLRGGRQFRLDAGNLFAYFDGATVGYHGQSFQASAFAGQRVALYVDTERGIVFGGTTAFDLKRGTNVPLRLAVDYMGLAINNIIGEGETRHMLAVTGQTRISPKARFDVRARLTGLPELDEMGVATTKFAPGRVGGRLRYDTGKLIFVGDAEYRSQDDIAYDLATPAAVDIVQVAQQLGVGLAKPVDSVRVGGRVDWMNAKKSFEMLAFAASEQPLDKADIVTVDNKAYVEGGVGIAGTPLGVRGSGVYTTAQYTYRQYTDQSVVDGMRVDGVGSDFGNSAFSGIDRMHQIAAEAALATRGSEGKRWRFSAGGFFRVYDFHSPYREVTNDARGGGRAELQWWFQRDLHLQLSGEIAQASPTLARELGTMSSLRAALEARW